MMGRAYLLTALIPALFIPEKLHDPLEADRRASAIAGPSVPAA